MPNINRRKMVNYSQEQMYALVNDVSSYSQFLPHCTGSEVISSTDEEVHATLTFARGGLHKSFTTLNRLQPHKMIEIRLVNGPFKHLEGFWRFEAHQNNGCCVSLDLAFEFSSHWLGLMFGPLFNQVAAMLVDAFCQRAEKVYGKMA
jgi:ribosome-associated toxin RatA of RatAB toxin-antitoxin module